MSKPGDLVEVDEFSCFVVPMSIVTGEEPSSVLVDGVILSVINCLRELEFLINYMIWKIDR